jgi:hypothetical protein
MLKLRAWDIGKPFVFGLEMCKRIMNEDIIRLWKMYNHEGTF